VVEPAQIFAGAQILSSDRVPDLREGFFCLWQRWAQVLFPRLLSGVSLSQGDGMMMTEQEFRNEYLYSSTMVQVRKMLEMGMITEGDYCRIDTKMKGKYLPVCDGLLSEAWRKYPQNRA